MDGKIIQRQRNIEAITQILSDYASPLYVALLREKVRLQILVPATRDHSNCPESGKPFVLNFPARKKR
ncbi:hypothetical protein SMSP1_00891 [Sedimentisphaera salicampi]|nr:hypothetical protein SMSP1_00891 [Sedimentisphaera salicampi]